MHPASCEPAYLDSWLSGGAAPWGGLQPQQLQVALESMYGESKQNQEARRGFIAIGKDGSGS